MSEDETKLLTTDQKLDFVIGELRILNGRVSAIEAALTDQKLNTRPIWERALAEIAALRQEVQDGFRDFKREVATLAKDVLEVRADIDYAHRRIDKLEPPPQA